MAALARRQPLSSIVGKNFLPPCSPLRAVTAASQPLDQRRFRHVAKFRGPMDKKWLARVHKIYKGNRVKALGQKDSENRYLFGQRKNLKHILDFGVPDLTGFELKPYVAHNTGIPDNFDIWARYAEQRESRPQPFVLEPDWEDEYKKHAAGREKELEAARKNAQEAAEDELKAVQQAAKLLHQEKALAETEET